MQDLPIALCYHSCMGMNVLTLSALLAFWQQYPDSESALRSWYKRVRHMEYSSFAKVKADFPSADWVKGWIIFDIMGNHYRLVVIPNFEGKRFYIDFIGTHKQYDQWCKEIR